MYIDIEKETLQAIYQILDEVGPFPGEYESLQRRAWDLKHQFKTMGIIE